MFPRLVAAEHRSKVISGQVTTGNAELDKLLGGGLDSATTTLIMGPAGTGKSAIATRFAYASAQRGDKAAIFVFEERPATMLVRSAALGMNLGPLIERKNLMITPVDPAELAPDEFTHAVCEAVGAGAKLIVIDSLTGYLNAMPDARYLKLQMHELLSYLDSNGVSTIVTLTQSGFAATSSPLDLSYLADCIMVLRYFEARGHVRKAVSVLKKRSGPHEDSIREFTMGPEGISVGQPLDDVQGILSGVPTFVGRDGAFGDDRR